MLSDTDTDATLVEVAIEDVAVESDLELSSSEEEEIPMVNSDDEGLDVLDTVVAEEEDDSILLESSSEEEVERLSDVQSDDEIEVGIYKERVALLGKSHRCKNSQNLSKMMVLLYKSHKTTLYDFGSPIATPIDPVNEEGFGFGPHL